MAQKKIIQFFLLFVPLFFCFSCNRKEPSLRQLEPVIRSYPDSVLTLLNSMEPVHGWQRHKSYHALLKVMTLDILHYHFTNDSLINSAARYFDSYGSLHHRMLTQYYQGTTAFHLLHYPKAIIHYEACIDLAKKENNLLYLGLAYRNISLIHLNNYEYNVSESNIHKAITYFEAGEYPEHLESARLKLAETLQQAGENEKADSVYRVVLSHSQGFPLVYSAYKKLAHLIDIKTRADAEYVLDLYDKGGVYGYSCGDISNMAYAYSYINQDTSDMLFSEAYHIASNALDTARIQHFRYLIYKNQQNYREALSLYENVVSKQDSIISLQLQQSLISSLNDFYRRENEISRLKTKNTKLIALILVGASILIFLLLIGLLIFSKRKQQELLDSITETKRVLMEREDDNFRLVKTMMMSKISDLEEAIKKYESLIDTRDEALAYKELRQKINALQKDKNLYREIEVALETYHGGIISKARHDFPELTENNYHLMLLLFAHIPQSTISLLRNASAGSIKTAKYRLRKLFRESGSPRKNDYLYLLDS